MSSLVPPPIGFQRDSSQLKEDIDYHHEQRETKNHEKRDSAWIKYFLLYQWFIYLIAVLAFSYGQPLALKAPYDPDNQACGLDINVQAFPYIYFATPSEKYLFRTVCVSECPKLAADQQQSDESLQILCSPNSVITSCQNHPSVNSLQYQVLYYDTVTYKDVCLPVDLQVLQLILPSAIEHYVSSHLHDFVSARYVILFSVLICLSFNTCLLQCLHKKTKEVVYVVIAVLEFSSGGIAMIGFLYATQFAGLKQLKGSNDHTILSEEEVIFQAQALSVSYNLVLVLSITASCIFLILPAAVYYQRIKIQQLINKLRIASEFLCTLGDDLSGVPIVTSILLTINFILWFAIALYIFSIGSVVKKPNELPYEQFSINPLAVVLITFHVFQLLWTTSTIIDGAEYIHQAAFVLCYEHKMKNPNEPLVSPPVDHRESSNALLEDDEKSYLEKARYQFLFYHVGSVIKGGILITLVTPFQWMFTLFRSFRQQMESCCPTALFTCCNQCYLKKIGIYQQDAYIFSFLKNIDFDDSALMTNAWKDNFYNDLREYGQIGRTFTLICQCSVSAFNSFIVFLILTHSSIQPKISSPATLTLLSFFFSYSITQLFMSVYGSCIDTLYFLMKRDSPRPDLQGGLNAPVTLRYLVSKNIEL